MLQREGVMEFLSDEFCVSKELLQWCELLDASFNIYFSA